MIIVKIVNNSSIVNKAIRTISNFFKKKFLQHKKHKTNKNQLTKQKQANIKKQKQRFFAHKNFIRGGKLFILRFLLFKISF